jgi:hypothetical protein
MINAHNLLPYPKRFLPDLLGEDDGDLEEEGETPAPLLRRIGEELFEEGAGGMELLVGVGLAREETNRLFSGLWKLFSEDG